MNYFMRIFQTLNLRIAAAETAGGVCTPDP